MRGFNLLKKRQQPPPSDRPNPTRDSYAHSIHALPIKNVHGGGNVPRLAVDDYESPSLRLPALRPPPPECPRAAERGCWEGLKPWRLTLAFIALGLVIMVVFLSLLLIQGNVSDHPAQPLDQTANATTDVPQSSSNVRNCSESFKHYCFNGGSCFQLVRENITACSCPLHFGGERCEKFQWYSRNNCAQLRMGDFPFGNMTELVLAILFSIAILVIVFQFIIIKNKSSKLERLKRKLRDSTLNYDYDSFRLPKSVYNRQISAISEEKNRAAFSDRRRPVSCPSGLLTALWPTPAPPTEQTVKDVQRLDNAQGDTEGDRQTAFDA